ncbi:uncharacterized protein LOC132048910 [Lycium ferocissimum]|uniref:uncharacterized protein LOC132048910 n=1 Tax=Lycium ferocissimum TaxID=112874 RepID=UPI0028151E24|nr:uncharacterized protein LOC132048910 [Lycium ferocissimum]
MNNRRGCGAAGNRGLQVQDPPVEVEVENVFADMLDRVEYASAIVPPWVNAAYCQIVSTIYQLLKLEEYFQNSTDDDPHQHLKNFVGVCTQHMQNVVPNDAIQLRVFKYSLAGEARVWFEKLPHNTIHTWEELVAVFLKKWFLPSKKAEILDKIYDFKQLLEEQLYEAWERFKEYLQKSPNHGFLDHILMVKFYRGLDPLTQAVENNAAGGTESVAYGAPMIHNIMKQNQETQQTTAQLATNTSLLTKIFDDREVKKVNVVEEVPGIPKGMYQVQEGSYQEGPSMQFEDANYVNNSQWGYQRQNYQGGYQNKTQNEWRPQQGQGNYSSNYGGSNQGNYNNNNNFGNRSSNPYILPKGQPNQQGNSKLESMLEKVLANQDKADKTLKRLTETVGSHTASIQKLKSQMRDISGEQHPP